MSHQHGWEDDCQPSCRASGTPAPVDGVPWMEAPGDLMTMADKAKESQAPVWHLSRGPGGTAFPDSPRPPRSSHLVLPCPHQRPEATRSPPNSPILSHKRTDELLPPYYGHFCWKRQEPFFQRPKSPGPSEPACLGQALKMGPGGIVRGFQRFFQRKTRTGPPGRALGCLRHETSYSSAGGGHSQSAFQGLASP